MAAPSGGDTFAIEIDPSHYRKVARQLDKGQINKRTRKAMDESLGLVHTLARSNLMAMGHNGGPLADTGGLIASLFTEQRGNALDTVQGIMGSPLVYAVVHEKGRRPGATAPPQTALLNWVRRKWGVEGSAASSAAFVLARTIKGKGIKGKKFMELAADVARPRVPAIWVKHFKIHPVAG